jgi:hypothetical protein
MTQTILTYLLEGGGLALLARALWFVWIWYVARRDEKSAIRAVTGRGEIREALRELRYDTPANYVQLVRVHNGGGNLMSGQAMYMSCVFEERDALLPSIREELQGIEIDEPYRALLASLMEVKEGWRSTEEVEDPLLQDLYKLMGAKYVRSALISARRDGIYLLRCTSSTEELGGAGAQKLNIHFRQAMSVLKKHY